jgi:phenylalanyl-tRNA synthetase beta chain
VGIYAPTGALIPCYGERLKVAKIRGVESMGMMCSEKELLVGDDHSGIIELPQDTAIGKPAAEVLNIDPVIEVSITPNRAECLGVRGIARDLAASGIGTLKPLNIPKIKGTFKRGLSYLYCPLYQGSKQPCRNTKVDERSSDGDWLASNFRSGRYYQLHQL